MAPTKAPDDGKVGLSTAIALIMGSIIGTGVFAMPSGLATFGWWGFIGLLVASIGGVLLAILFAALSRRKAMQGGPYAYAREAFGDFAGFTNAWAYWCAAWPGNSAIVVAWSAYVMYLIDIPDTASNSWIKIIICAFGLGIPTIINMFGARSMGAFQVITTVLKVIPLIFFATVGVVYAFMLGNWPTSFAVSGGGSPFGAVTTAVIVAMFSYVGVEVASIAASTVRKPRVNVPKATMYGTIGTAVVYVLVTLAIYGIVPNDALQDTTASLAAAATYMFGAGVGGVAGKIIAAFAVISGIGALNSWAMICGQVPQAAARDGVFPAFFNKENKFGVPYWGILSGTVLAMILVVVASMGAAGNQVYIVIVSVSSVAVGIPYFFSCLAQLYWLYTDGRRLHHPTFVKDATVAILALVVSVVMIAGAGQLSVFAGFLVILLGWIILLAMFIMKGRYGVTSFDQVGVPIDQDPKAMAAYVASQESTD